MDENNNELVLSEVLSGIVDEVYIINLKEIKDYLLVKVLINVSGKFMIEV